MFLSVVLCISTVIEQGTPITKSIINGPQYLVAIYELKLILIKVNPQKRGFTISGPILKPRRFWCLVQVDIWSGFLNQKSVNLERKRITFRTKPGEIGVNFLQKGGFGRGFCYSNHHELPTPLGPSICTTTIERLTKKKTSETTRKWTLPKSQ